jgi:hypothetical protein
MREILRDLKNYISMHPEARGARTLTEARRKAFGQKTKTFTCRCKQAGCKRRNGGKDSAC